MSGIESTPDISFREEIMQLVSKLDPYQSYTRLITTFYLLKSVLLEEGYYEEGLNFGKRIREIENSRQDEDPEFKARLITEVRQYLLPFCRLKK